MKEEDIQKIFDEITSDNDLEKNASSNNQNEFNVDDLIGELEKTASELEGNKEKIANEEDVQKFKDKAVGKTIKLESEMPAKQKLKEIALLGLKNDQQDEKYIKLKKALSGKEEGAKLKKASADELIEYLSDQLAEQILNELN